MASSRDALRADSDLRAYSLRPCHRRDGTAGTPELIYRCFHSRTSTLSVTTTGRPEQPEDGPCRRRPRAPRDSHESAVGRLEQLTDVGRSDPALSGLNDHATTGSGPTRQSGARDSELLQVSRHVQGHRFLTRGWPCSCTGQMVLNASDISFFGNETLTHKSSSCVLGC